MPATRLKSQLMSASEIDRTLVRLAHEVVEKNEGLDRLAIIGIHRRGAVLGERRIRSSGSKAARCRSEAWTLRSTATTVPKSASGRWSTVPTSLSKSLGKT